MPTADQAKAATRAAWRDFNEQDLPSSGLRKPIKKEQRDALDTVVDIVASAAEPFFYLTPAKSLITTDTALSSITNGASIGGVTVVTGDRVVKAVDPAIAGNGVFVVQSSGPAVRATDADAGAELVTGGKTARLQILAGTHSGEYWQVTNATAPAVGTDALGLTFVGKNADLALKLDKTATISTSGALSFTGTDLGTGLTLALAVADQAAAEAGLVETNAVMTPLRTTQHFDSRVSSILRGANTFLAATTLAEARTAIGVGYADQATAEAGSSSTTVMTPQRASQHLTARIGVSVQAHDAVLDGLATASSVHPDAISAVSDPLIRPTSDNDLVVLDEAGGVAARLGGKRASFAGLEVYAEGDGFIFVDQRGMIVHRFGPGFASISGMRLIADGRAEPVFVDQHGGVVFRPFRQRGGQEVDVIAALQPSDMNLYFGTRLYGVAGERTLLNVATMLADPNDAALVDAGYYPSQGDQQPMTGTAIVIPNLALNGAKARIEVAPRFGWQGGVHARLVVNHRVAEKSPVSGGTFNLLVVGDSIPTYQGIYLTKSYLTAWGYTATLVGSLDSMGTAEDPSFPGSESRFAYDANMKGEVRPGIELADYTYRSTTVVSPVDPGDEAAYLAMGRTDKRARNPFLRAADVGDDEEDILNGYVVDFGFYRSRFSYPTINAFNLSIGTNDANALDVALIYERFLADLQLMHRRWRAYSATGPMILHLPGRGRGVDTSDRDADLYWRTRYVEMRKACLDFVNAAADANLHFCPAYAHVLNAGGYEYTGSPEAVDPTTGVKMASTPDNAHPTLSTRDGLFKANAATIAYAVTHIA